ncbi:hypothetical protein [Tessaracoccus coleopterorum]|uniref:hypothetical protein n=1 Tax=Tessaracoccus coleopterorum TaxID=2714950 RepID=UPI0018D3ACB4|nr:hypothetical protein [Tessaracoccus coleopterorum]
MPETILFVDGVRRVEARLWLRPEDGDDVAPGLCASYAAGVVRSTRTAATVEVAEVRRALLTTSDAADDIGTRLGTWTAVHAKPDATKQVFDLLSLALQDKLAELEIICAANARAATDGGDDDLLVIDGPLRGRTKVPRAIGMIKSQQSAYLTSDLNRVVGTLNAGQRTPVFLLGTSWERYSWYLRLPGAGGSPWAGIVRVECSHELSREEAIALASLSQAVLPRYASESFKDPRARRTCTRSRAWRGRCATASATRNCCGGP